MRCLARSLSVVFALAAGTATVEASLISVATQIPDSEVLLNYFGSGLDWTYAGPVAPNGYNQTPGEIELPSYRANEGWRFATDAEWAKRPYWTDFIKPGYTVDDLDMDSQFNHSAYRFTTEYWSTFTHVDTADARQGLITNGLDFGDNWWWETWYVRDTGFTPTLSVTFSAAVASAGVPEPTSAALLGLGICGATICKMRRRRPHCV